MLYQMTVVLRNGASIQMPTTIPRTTPLFLREVPSVVPRRTCHLPTVSSQFVLLALA